MSAVSKIDPFPRVDNPSTPAFLAPSWGPVSVCVDGAAVERGQASGAWDRNSTLSVRVPVSISIKSLEHLRTERIALAVTLSCGSTCRSSTATAVLVRQDGGILHGEATVELQGSEIAEYLALDAVLIAQYSPLADSAPWLRRRIAASMDTIRIPLEDEEQGFPTSAVSFAERRWPVAPWRVLVDASDPADSFSRCVRLYLNQDLAASKKIIEWKAPSSSMTLLKMSIVRALIVWAEGVRESAVERTLDDTAADHPESVAAAARRAATQHLGCASLREGLELLRNRPDFFEMELMSRMGFLR